MSNKILNAKKRIIEIKRELKNIGAMRPGKISRQKRKNTQGEQYGSYWQLSYTYKMISKTVYIPEELAKAVQVQNKEYKRFKSLMEEWIDLAHFLAQSELEMAKKKIRDEAEK
jgi:hypothetical protein